MLHPSDLFFATGQRRYPGINESESESDTDYTPTAPLVGDLENILLVWRFRHSWLYDVESAGACKVADEADRLPQTYQEINKEFPS